MKKFLTAFSTSLLLTLSANAGVFDDAFAIYDLNGNANESVSGLNGNTTGSISGTTDRYGNANGATLFTNAYMNMPNSNDFKFGTDDFSVSFWVKIDPITSTHLDNVGLLHNYSSTSNGSSNWGLTMKDGYNGANPGKIGGSLDGVNLTPTVIDIDDSQWHHLAIVRDAQNSNVKFYYDGLVIADATSTTLQNIQNPNAPLALGNHLGRAYTFAADELVFLNRTLSGSEVAGLAGTAVPEPNSMALWSLCFLGAGLARRKKA